MIVQSASWCAVRGRFTCFESHGNLDAGPNSWNFGKCVQVMEFHILISLLVDK